MAGRYNKKKKDQKLEQGTRQLSVLTEMNQRKRTCDKKAELDSSLITAKRLTVGVKGIFGNVRSSNSVYRDFQRRLDKRKLSKEVTSEIEHNLSRILPNRKKCTCNHNGSETDTGFHTPSTGSAKLLTPNSNCSSGNNNSASKYKTRSASLSSSITRITQKSTTNTTTTVCNTHHSTSTPIVQDEFSRIANDIVDSIPKLNILKSYDLLESIYSDLSIVHQETHHLKIICKYPDMESQETQEYGENDIPASKKHCSFEEMDELNSVEPKKESVGDCLEEKPSVILPISEQTNTEQTAESMDVSSSDQQFQQQQQQMFPSKPIVNIDQEPQSQQQQQQQQNFLEQYHHSSTTNNNNNNNNNNDSEWFGTDVQTILQQPISNLRCNRRRSSTRYQSSSQHQSLSHYHAVNETQQQKHSDILDYIDKIPIKDLEMELLDKRTSKAVNNNNNENGGGGRRFQDRNVELHHYHHQNIASLEKPNVLSPSPPKMYRMSMF